MIIRTVISGLIISNLSVKINANLPMLLFSMTGFLGGAVDFLSGFWLLNDIDFFIENVV